MNVVDSVAIQLRSQVVYADEQNIRFVREGEERDGRYQNSQEKGETLHLFRASFKAWAFQERKAKLLLAIQECSQTL